MILTKQIIATDKDDVKTGDSAIILDTDLKIEFDNILGRFERNLYYYYIVDLEYITDDKLEYSNGDNGSPIVFKTKIYKITKIWEKTY